MTASRLVLVLNVFVCSTLMGGCAKRALHMVEFSGDRALEAENYPLAEHEYAEVADRAPYKAQARLRYGKALLGAGKPAQAREQLEKAYTLMPKSEEVIENLAEAMAQSRDMEGAVRLLRTIAEDGKRPSDWLRLGRFLLRTNDSDAAETAFLTAARGDRGQSLEPQWALALFYKSIGNDKAAIERLRMCQYVDPQNSKVQDMIRSYGEIPGPTFAKPPAEQIATANPSSAIPQ